MSHFNIPPGARIILLIWVALCTLFCLAIQGCCDVSVPYGDCDGDHTPNAQDCAPWDPSRGPYGCP